MILKVSCISVAYNAAFMRVNGPITLSTSLADPDPEIIWGTGGGGRRVKKFQPSGRQHSLKVRGASPLAPSLDPPLHTTNKQCESIVPPEPTRSSYAIAQVSLTKTYQ